MYRFERAVLVERSTGGRHDSFMAPVALSSCPLMFSCERINVDLCYAFCTCVPKYCIVAALYLTLNVNSYSLPLNEKLCSWDKWPL